MKFLQKKSHTIEKMLLNRRKVTIAAVIAIAAPKETTTIMNKINPRSCYYNIYEHTLTLF